MATTRQDQMAAEVWPLLHAAGYDVQAAARRAGISSSTMYWRIKSAGIPMTEIMWRRRTPGVTDPTTPPTATVTTTGVQLSHADYALLQSQAAYGLDCQARDAELARAEGVIATLTRHVADLAARLSGVPAVAMLLLALLVPPAQAQTPPAYDFGTVFEATETSEVTPTQVSTTLQIGKDSDQYRIWRGASHPLVVVSPDGKLRVTMREYAPRRMDVVERVASSCPGLILQDHAFTDSVATLLWQEDNRWGRNGKRGNANDPSHDAIAYRTSASPFGVAIIDIIGAAGSPSASPAWLDQTDATIAANTTGVWVAPSGRLPPCLTGAAPVPVPTPGTPPPVITPPQQTDLSEVLSILSRIEDRITALEDRETASSDMGLVNLYIDAMIGNGPGEGAPNHVNDLLQRLDAARADLASLTAWLRGRAVLRY